MTENLNRISQSSRVRGVCVSSPVGRLITAGQERSTSRYRHTGQLTAHPVKLNTHDIGRAHDHNNIATAPTMPHV